MPYRNQQGADFDVFDLLFDLKLEGIESLSSQTQNFESLYLSSLIV